MSSGPPATVRSVFIIDPQHVIRTTFTYPASTGRNFDEICGSLTRSSDRRTGGDARQLARR
jgi:alkyl hydroperoxide reductase subunit AhpC